MHALIDQLQLRYAIEMHIFELHHKVQHLPLAIAFESMLVTVFRFPQLRNFSGYKRLGPL